MSLKKKIVILICSLIFISLVIMYYTNNLEWIDNFFYNHIISLKSDTTTSFFIYLTVLGGAGITVLLINFNLLLNKKKGLYFIINIVIVVTLNFILKLIFMRQRPTVEHLVLENWYSFPSGHSMNSVALYGLLIYYMYHSKRNKYLRVIGIILSVLFIILVPISRVYLGVHFFSDILAGICLSMVWLMFYTEYLKSKGI